MKWLGALALAVVVVVGLLTMLGQGPSVPGLGLGAPPPPEPPALGYAARAARLVQTDDAGQPRYTLEAGVLRQEPGSDDLLADDITLRYAAPPGGKAPPWLLTARAGRLPPAATSLHLSGDVTLAGRPPGGRDTVTLTTQGLDFDIDAQVARTRLPVTLRSGGARLDARGLTADLKQGSWRLESSVHGRFSP